MPWIKPDEKISRKAIDRAGLVLAGPSASDEERNAALSIIGRWRASHGYPLNAIKQTLQNRARRIDPDVLVAQRLKRLPSIEAKLRHPDNPHMKLTQMQDIGGCRAVLSTMAEVDALLRVYERAAVQSETATRERDRGPELIGIDNYIETPKPTGYSSAHLIYKYRSTSDRSQIWNGTRIEIQIRTRLQHAWATAVESVSAFTQQQLKANLGDEGWKRFFALMGTAIAAGEGRPLVPGTPENPRELAEEIADLYDTLRVPMVLGGFTKAVESISEGGIPSDARVYLLVLNLENRSIRISGYREQEQARASEEYLEAEKAVEANPNLNAVLVSVESISALRAAFPNYFLDIDTFGFAVSHALEAGLVEEDA